MIAAPAPDSSIRRRSICSFGFADVVLHRAVGRLLEVRLRPGAERIAAGRRRPRRSSAGRSAGRRRRRSRTARSCASRSSGGCSQKPPSKTTRIRSCGRAARVSMSGSTAASSSLCSSRGMQPPSAISDVGLVDGEEPGRLALDRVELAQQAAVLVEDARSRRAAPSSVTSRPGDRLDRPPQPVVLCREIGGRVRRVGVLRQVEDLARVVEVAPPDRRRGCAPRRRSDA